MNNEHERLDALLRRDPVAEAERAIEVLGLRDGHPGVAVGLSLLTTMDLNREKDAVLAALDDTKFSNTVSDYLRIAASEGFVEQLRVPFTVADVYGGRSQESREETLYILFNDREGILLVFDTYGGTDVNGGKFYFNWRANRWHRRTLPERFSGGCGRDGVVNGYLDCREALRHNLAALRRDGRFVVPWQARPFLWLLHYGDERQGDYDYEKINAERIRMLPEYIQQIIAGETSPGRRDRYTKVYV